MSSPDLRPAQNFEFGPESEGQEASNEAQMADLKKAMFHGNAEDSKNIVIVVGPTEERFVVNKCLAMLASHEMEKLIKGASRSNGLLKFPEVHPNDFRLILEFTILENNWTYTNLKDACRIIETAAQFGFYDFIRIIGQTLLRVVQSRDDVFNAEDVCRALILFRNYDVGNEILESKAFNYILENVSVIFNGNQYLHLPLEDFGEILLQDGLRVDSEIEVLNALIRWGMNILKNESKESSTENLRKVLAYAIFWIRFPNIAENEFWDYVIPLQILSDEHVKIMEQWYGNRNQGTQIVFSTRSRNYVRAKDPEFAAADVRITAEFLHKIKMDNLLAKFKMDAQAHNWGIENAKLQKQVELMKSFIRETKSYKDAYAASKTWKNLESLAKYVKDSQRNLDDISEKDFQVLVMVVDKIRKYEDLCDLEGDEEVNNPKNVDLQILETVKEIKLRIREVKNFVKSIIDETLMWKIFQKESNSTVVELQKFKNTQASACAIIFKNNTSESLTDLKICPTGHQVYMGLPRSIQPFCSHNYGQTDAASHTWGALSYTIGSMRILVRHYFQLSYNDFGIAIAPLRKAPMTHDYTVFTGENWANDSTKIKALCQAPTEIEKCITFGNLHLHAELIGTWPKAILRVMLSTL